VDLLEVLYDRAEPVSHADAGGIVPTSATCTLRKADGSTLQTPAVTLPTGATTIAAGSTALVLVLAGGGAWLRPGDPLAIVSQGETYVCMPTRVDGLTVYLAAALPNVPTVGSTVAALKMSATITAPGVGELGAGLRLEWRYASATQSGYASAEVAVVRWLWQEPIAAAQVAELLAVAYQTTRSEQLCRDVAARVSLKIRNAIEQTGRRPWLYVSPGAFAEVAQIGVRWVLADLGIGQAGDPSALLREYRFAFNDELTKAIAGLKGYDVAGDGTSDPSKLRNVVSIRAVR
jgi:hypothetical protein